MARRVERSLLLLAVALVPLVGCTPTVSEKLSTAVDSTVFADVPESTQEPRASTPSVSRSDVFGGGVVDLLNAVDLGDRDDKLAVCQGVSDVVAGMTQTQIDDAKSAMTAYDRSTLQDLVTECEAL